MNWLRKEWKLNYHRKNLLALRHCCYQLSLSEGLLLGGVQFRVLFAIELVEV